MGWWIIDEAGFLDLHGSGVVHLCGITAFGWLLVLGARKGKYVDGKSKRHLLCVQTYHLQHLVHLYYG